jgi:type IV secretory pathway VirB10-like protein
MKDYVEPHFNDEQTLLTARRVVPLEKIEKKARHRRQWFLGGAFAIAMMLGAASALVASYLKFRNAPQAATEAVVEPDDVPALATVESTPSATPTPEVEQVAETAPPVTPRKEPKHRTVPVQDRVEPIDDRDTRQASKAEQLQQIRDAVLYDEWQERRARRVLRRERRRAERYNHRDLSNLDEIFEGRRRRSDRP